MFGKKKKLSDDQLEEVNGGQGELKILHAPKLIMPRLLLILKKNNDQAQQAPSANKEE